jgi:hypothetical protein
MTLFRALAAREPHWAPAGHLGAADGDGESAGESESHRESKILHAYAVILGIARCADDEAAEAIAK